jgi:hypothetical protein
MPDHKQTLDAIQPTPRRVQVGGASIEVLPLRVRELPAFARAVGPLAPLLARGEVVAALTEHAEGLIEATAIGARVEREWLVDQELDVLVELAAAVVEANLDFFAQRIAPRLRRAVVELGALMADGTTPSSG